MLFEIDSVESTGADNEYDSPYNSKWIAAIGVCGTVVVVKKPNIHYSFLTTGVWRKMLGFLLTRKMTPVSMSGFAAHHLEKIGNLVAMSLRGLMLLAQEK